MVSPCAGCHRHSELNESEDQDVLTAGCKQARSPDDTATDGRRLIDDQHRDLGPRLQVHPIDGADRAVEDVGRSVGTEHETFQIVRQERQDDLRLDGGHVVVVVQTGHDLGSQTGQIGRIVAVLLCHLEFAVGILQIPGRRGRVAREEVLAVAVDVEEVRHDLVVGRLGLLLAVDVVGAAGPGQQPHAGADDGDHRQQADDRDGGTLLPLPSNGHGRHSTAGHGPLGHAVEEAVDAATQPAVGDDLGLPGRCLDGGHAAGHGVGQGDRRAFRGSGHRIARPDRLERRRLVSGRDLGGLDDHDAVAAGAAEAARPELAVDLLDGGLRMQLHDRVLDRAQADAPGDVRGHEDEAVARGYLAVPDLGAIHVVDGQAAVRARVREGQEPRLPDEVSLGRAERGHVELVAPDYGEGETDRTGFAGGRRPACPASGRGPCWPRRSPSEGRRNAGRQVVVVVIPYTLGNELGRLAQLAPTGPRDEQVQAPLGARRRADDGLDNDDGVG